MFKEAGYEPTWLLMTARYWERLDHKMKCKSFLDHQKMLLSDEEEEIKQESSRDGHMMTFHSITSRMLLPKRFFDGRAVKPPQIENCVVWLLIFN